MSKRVFAAVVALFAVTACSQSDPQSFSSGVSDLPAISVAEFVVETSVRQALPIPWAGWQSDPAVMPGALPLEDSVKVVLDAVHAKWAEEKAVSDAESARLQAEVEAQANQVSDAGSSKGSSGGGSKGGSSGGSKASSGNGSSSGGNAGGGNTGGENAGGGSNPGGSSGGGAQPVQVPCGIAPCQTAHVVTADDGAASQFCAAINAHRDDSGLPAFSCSVGKQSDAVAMANAGKTGGHGFTISTANGPGVGTLRNSPAHNNWMLRPDKTAANVGCAKKTHITYLTATQSETNTRFFCGARID